jgi:hypothetical protein
MTVNSLNERLDSIPEFRGVIEDANVKHVMIQPSGRFEYVKLGRHRTGTATVSRDLLELYSEIAASGGRTGEWMVRVYDGAWGMSFLLERLPTTVVDRMPPAVLNNLKRLVRKDGMGMILGSPGSSKSTILLWLAMQSTEETIVLVSENPPVDLPSNHLIHVYPPSSPEQRRQLERLVRLSATVFWDRATVDDLVLLLTFPTARRRWFSMDGRAKDVPNVIRAMEGRGLAPRLDAILLVSTSVIGRSEVQNLVIRESGEWDEVYAVSDPMAHLLGRPPLAISQALPAVRPAAAPVPAPEASPEGVGLQEPSSMGIRKRPGHPTVDFDNPLTIPVDQIDPEFLMAESDIAEADQATGLISGADLAALGRRSAKDSGEIEVPAFANSNLPEVTRQYTESMHHSQTATADAEFLNNLLPTIQRDRSTSPAHVNLEDMRITRAEEVEDRDIEHSRALRDAYLKVQGEAERENVEFEDQFHEDDDDDSEVDEVLAGVVSESQLEEISGIFSTDDIATSVASATDFVLAGWKSKPDNDDTRQEFLSDPDTNPTMSAAIQKPVVENHDLTEEVNLGDKLRLMRARFHRKDD